MADDNPYWKLFVKITEIFDEYSETPLEEEFPGFFYDLGSVAELARECAIRTDNS